MTRATLLICMGILLLALPAQADEKAERELIDQAQEQLDRLGQGDIDATTRMDAVRKLAAIHARMKKLAAADPNFDKRSWQDEFKAFVEDTDPFLDEQARELGVSREELAKPATPAKAGGGGDDRPPDRARQGCETVPIPNFPKGRDTETVARELARSTDALRDQLARPRGETWDAIAKQDAERHRRLAEMALDQIRLAWAAGGQGDPREIIDLKNQNDALFAALKRKAGKDAEADKLYQRHEEYREKFNGLKKKHAEGSHWTGFGGTAVGTGPLSWWAQKLANEIRDVWAKSNADYQEYLRRIEPLEEGARKVLNDRVQRGVDAINYRLKQQHAGPGPPPKFELYRPKTVHEREELDRLIGTWLKLELELVSMRSSQPWADWSRYKDFDFDDEGKRLTSGPACAPAEEAAPEPAPEPEPEREDRSEAPEPEKKSGDCQGGGLLGGMNCVEKRIERGY